MITGAQCRSARTLLTWSVGKLANAASVSESAVNDFELERQPQMRQPPMPFNASLRVSAWSFCR